MTAAGCRLMMETHLNYFIIIIIIIIISININIIIIIIIIIIINNNIIILNIIIVSFEFLECKTNLGGSRSVSTLLIQVDLGCPRGIVFKQSSFLLKQSSFFLQAMHGGQDLRRVPLNG